MMKTFSFGAFECLCWCLFRVLSEISSNSDNALIEPTKVSTNQIMQKIQLCDHIKEKKFVLLEQCEATAQTEVSIGVAPTICN